MTPVSKTTRKNDDDNGWHEWSRHVLAELERLNGVCELMRVDIAKVRIDIARLQVKAGVWGLIGGSIPVIIALILWMMKK